MSIRTGIYSNRFISKLWAERGTFSEYERRGFFQFLYITACSNLEVTIADYLKAVVSMPVFEMKLMEENGYPVRGVTTNGEMFEVSMQQEWMAIRRIVERTLDEIDNAPIQRLKAHHVTILGKSIQDLIGKNLYSHLEGLVSARNLLAHGRELYIELIHPMEFTVSFEKHPLEDAMKCLKLVGLYKESDYKGVRDKDAREVIYKDRAVMHFWNVAMEIILLYENRAKAEKLQMMGVNNMEALT